MSQVRCLLIVLTCMLSAAFSDAQPLARRVAAALQDFRGTATMRHAVISMTVLDARNGHILFEENKDVGLAPASCLKTVTAATAFYLLGAGYRYETQLLYSGTLQNGVLQGDLIIRGSGDPTLGSWRYDSTKTDFLLNGWVGAVKAAGIRSIQGRIIGDASVFNTQLPPDGWIWQDIGNYYGAGASGLSWRENQYDLFLKPGSREGDPVEVLRTDPPMPQLEFRNELTTGAAGSGDRTYIYAAPYSHLAYLRGTCPPDKKNFSVSGSVPDPALFCAGSLYRALADRGITVSGSFSTLRLLDIKTLPSDAKVLSVHRSPALTGIIYWFLHRSINLYGEHLVKTFALEQRKQVSTEAGVEAEKMFWAQHGIDSTALNIFDGSGLSPGNRITSLAMALILYKIRKEPWFADYRECLPRIHGITMKDGYINNVRSYAGYHTSKEGVPLVFSFIVNNFYDDPSFVRIQMWKVLDQL